MRKKIVIITALMSAIFLSGCSVSSFSGPKDRKDVVVPDGDLGSLESNNIDIGGSQLELPSDMILGKVEIEAKDAGYTLYGLWDKGDNDFYIEKKDNDISFYMIEGIDTKTPDDVLDSEKVKASMSSYMQKFEKITGCSMPRIDNVNLTDETGASIKNEAGKNMARISTDKKWYYTTFTCNGGDKLSTTYGSLCYPKTYYGFIMMQANHDKDYARKFNIIAFSNNKKGEIFEEDEYNSVFSQIKSIYSLDKFYSEPQIKYNPELDYSNGRSYAQFQEMFADTKNYYILKDSEDK
ncbi:MAG: hypothetical protein K5769_06040 [Pseudobutyrivibrio sp.]|nr:hypothetical protein [Pseudobutyrivibrio sp.]